MRRRSAGTAMPARLSVSTSSSRRTSPASGARRPEIMLTSVVLPLPERPKTAVMPGVGAAKDASRVNRSEEHTSELQSQSNLVCRLLLEKKNSGLEHVSQPANQTHND